MNFSITTVPFPFTDQHGFAYRQHNAIQSWLRLDPVPEIVLLGDDEGVEDYASRYNLRHVGGLTKNEDGALDCSVIFAKAQGAVSHDVMCYIDCDVILLPDFVSMVRHVVDNYENFLVVGGRWSARIDHKLDFAANWQRKVLGAIHRHHEHGSDYFVFRPGLFDRMPPFAIGAGAWDGWKMWYAMRRGAELIRADYVTKAVHQDHGPRWRTRPGRQRNQELTGKHRKWVNDATVTLRPRDV